ncbi:MAG: transposase [Acidobacteria bacterium]|nr:transposase [Acidobacteriota bacterium]
MRPKTDLQVSIFDFFSEHTIGRELRAISDFLDANPGFCDRIAQTVTPTDTKPTGRKGFSADQILRFAVFKQFTGYSFRELAFYLEDSETFRTFARCWKKAPSFTTLQSLLRKVDSIAWEANNRFLVLVAKEKGIENGEVRIFKDTQLNSSEGGGGSLLCG